MENKKFLVFTPVILAGTALPYQSSNASVEIDKHPDSSNYVQTQEIEDKWLIRIINYYYEKLEDSLNNITSRTTFNEKELQEVKKQTIHSKIFELYKEIEKVYREGSKISNPGSILFPIDKKDFHPYLSPITSFYGPRSLTRYRTSFIHKAIDIMANGGTAVISPWPGQIVYATKETYFNLYTVLIYHGKGVYTRWAHINPVKNKGFVNAGDVFARVKYKSRFSTGPHVHMEIIKRQGDSYYTVNPYSKDNDYSFTLMENKKALGRYETHFENMRFESSYDKFLRRAKRLYRRYYKRTYKEMKKHRIHSLVWGNESLSINEKELDRKIVKNIRKHLKQKIVDKLLTDFDEMTLSPDFVKYFVSASMKLLDVTLSDKGGYYQDTADFKNYYRKSIDRFYPELIYESFKNYFSTLNLHIFAHIVDKVSISQIEKSNPFSNNKFLKKVLKYDKRLKSILWETYRKFNVKYNEQIKKFFFLNLDLPEEIDSLEKFIDYYRRLYRNKNNDFGEYENLRQKLALLDMKLKLLKQNRAYLFDTIINHSDFNKLIRFSEADFNVYLKKCFDDYIKSLELNSNNLDNVDLQYIRLREKDRLLKHVSEKFPLGDEFSKFIKVRDKGDRILIFFESPGHFLGQKIYGVKLVQKASENALFLIEQQHKLGKNYRVVARFKPKFSNEFNAKGFYFEIYKHEKILYLKSVDEFSQVKQYMKLNDLNNLYLNITVHPLKIEEKKSKVIKKLLKPFEYSVPIALWEFTFDENVS